MNIKVVRLFEDAKLPTKAHDDDVGFDLYTRSTDCYIGPGEFFDVECGIAIELPQGNWGMIQGRSSTIRKLGILVPTGIIDPGYRGPLLAGCLNMTRSTVVCIPGGSRIAQYIPFAAVGIGWEINEVRELSNTQRGTKGLGSSGR